MKWGFVGVAAHQKDEQMVVEGVNNFNCCTAHTQALRGKNIVIANYINNFYCRFINQDIKITKYVINNNIIQ